LLAAHDCFRREIEASPENWWAGVCLSIPARKLTGRADPEVPGIAEEQLEREIEKHPHKSIPRFFRLFHAMVLGRRTSYVAHLVRKDKAKCPKSMEVPGNLLELVGDPLRLLEPKRAARLTELLREWMQHFTLLLAEDVSVREGGTGHG
jgi:hypothetical protein